MDQKCVHLHTVLQFQIEAPLDAVENTETLDNENSQSKGSWVVNTLGGLIFALAIVALSIFAVMLAIRLRRQNLTDEHIEEDSVDDADYSELTYTNQEQAETLHVPSYNHLSSGGVYDQSTGQTVYVDPEGRWWWQQEDGSFLHNPASNTDDTTQDGLS